MDATSDSGSNGLERQSTAPCLRNLRRRSAVAFPVMKMTGTLLPERRISAYSSGPLMPGMAMSMTRHREESMKPEDRNASAEANARASYPKEPRRSGSDSRTDSSSSTMAMSDLTAMI